MTDGTGRLSQLADTIESTHLTTGAELLTSAEKLLADHTASSIELRFLATRLTQSLRDALRVAECRGDRLSTAWDEIVTDGVEDQGSEVE